MDNTTSGTGTYDLEYWKKLQQDADKWDGTQRVCPSCGYCPHCGRGGHYTQPWPYYQPYPYITWTCNTGTK